TSSPWFTTRVHRPNSTLSDYPGDGSARPALRGGRGDHPVHNTKKGPTRSLQAGVGPSLPTERTPDYAPRNPPHRAARPHLEPVRDPGRPHRPVPALRGPLRPERHPRLP